MKTSILIIGLVTLSSCQTTKVINQRYPMISKPDRPILSSEFDKEDFKAMVKYARKLEVSIEVYNGYAIEQNKKIEQYFKGRASDKR